MTMTAAKAKLMRDHYNESVPADILHRVASDAVRLGSVLVAVRVQDQRDRLGADREDFHSDI